MLGGLERERTDKWIAFAEKQVHLREAGEEGKKVHRNFAKREVINDIIESNKQGWDGVNILCLENWVKAFRSELEAADVDPYRIANIVLTEFTE